MLRNHSTTLVFRSRMITTILSLIIVQTIKVIICVCCVCCTVNRK